MIRKIAISLFLLIPLYGKVINGIAIKVNGLPITTFEIDEVSKVTHSREKSVELLIQQKLEESQIKKFQIQASKEEVDEYLYKIMAQNRVSSKEQFFKTLQYQGISKEEFLENLKKEVQKRKLYQMIGSSNLDKPKEREIEEFYEENKKLFRVAEKYDVTLYISNSISALQDKKRNPLLFYRNIQTQEKIYLAKNLNPQIREILSDCEVGEFCKITNLGDTYILFFLKKAEGRKTLELSKVKSEIENRVFGKKREEFFKNYFNRVKSEAVIEYLR